MQKQLVKVPSEGPSQFEIALRNISAEKILKEQADEAAVITVIVGQLQRIVRLYQIPNLAHGVDVELADWVYENYKYEPFGLVYQVLKNPPATEDKNWRLTPDTIRAWMSSALEKQAAERENEHHKAKWSDKDWSLMNWNNEAWAHIYNDLKLPATLQRQAKEDVKAELAKRFAPVDMEALKKRDEQNHE